MNALKIFLLVLAALLLSACPELRDEDPPLIQKNITYYPDGINFNSSKILKIRFNEDIAISNKIIGGNILAHFKNEFTDAGEIEKIYSKIKISILVKDPTGTRWTNKKSINAGEINSISIDASILSISFKESITFNNGERIDVEIDPKLVSDLSGNLNEKSHSGTIEVDLTAPEFVNFDFDVGKNNIRCRFNEKISLVDKSLNAIRIYLREDESINIKFNSISISGNNLVITFPPGLSLTGEHSGNCIISIDEGILTDLVGNKYVATSPDEINFHYVVVPRR